MAGAPPPQAVRTLGPAAAAVLTASLLGACLAAPPRQPDTRPVPATVSPPEPVPAAPVLVALPEVDVSGERFDEQGIHRYRFTSEVRILTRPRSIVSTYEGKVEVEPAAAHVVAEGFVGRFEVFVDDEGTHHRRPDGGGWQQVPGDPSRTFSPAGPLPGHAFAAAIAELASRRGVEVVGRSAVAGVDVTHALLEAGEGLRVEVWLSSEGVVMRERIVQVTDDGRVVMEWEIHDVNGEFTVPAPPSLDRDVGGG